jgi:uncharacterized repeat protein (TIGR01451 family)
MDAMMSKRYHSNLAVLSIVLFAVIVGIQATSQAAVSFDSPIAYEAVLVNDGPSEIELDRLEALPPPGASYVGLAAGSQIEREAQRVGDHLQWTGPFHLPPNSELTLRYWLAPTSPAVEIPTLEVVGYRAGEAVVQAIARPADLLPSTPAVIEGATSPLAVTVEKVAEPSELSPDDEPWVAYTVTFTNDISTPTVLDWITDTLAPEFQFVGMAQGSEVSDQPLDPHASTVVWQGPFLVPGNGHLRLRYWVKAVLEFGTYQNSVRAVGGGEQVGPATAEVEVKAPILSLDKSVSPATVTSGQWVVYDVTIRNTGNGEGVLEAITDTLPSGFTFKKMDPNSDIVAEPSGSSGTVVWTGPFTILPASQVHLIYQVRTSGVGAKVNSVVCRDSEGVLLGPETSTITVSKARVYVPLAYRNYQTVPPTTLPMEEPFTVGVPPEWTPFVNYPELSPSDWFWRGDGVTWGRYDYDPGEALEQWGLSMYLGEGAEEWTDYKIEATIRPGKQQNHPLVGIWFRGTHERRTDLLGGDVTGYIFCVRPDKDKVYLGYIDPNTRKLGFLWAGENSYPTEIWEWYDVTIEVRGANIQVWIEGVKMFDWTDPNATWMQGTVGFAVYRGSAGFDYIRVSALD